MSTFPCPHCGSELDAAGQEKVRCPKCEKEVQAPAAAAPTAEEEAQLQAALASSERMQRILSKAMPWVASILLHLGVFLIMMLVVAMATAPAPAVVINYQAADADFSDAAPTDKMALPGPQGTGPHLRNATVAGQLPRGPHEGWATVDRNNTSSRGWGQSTNANAMAEAYGSGGGASGGGGGDFGMARGGGFYGVGLGGGGGGGGGGKAYNIVYVLDASGSVLETFEGIRQELKNSIFKLNQFQTFHVIFFRGDSYLEAPQHRLVKAGLESKKEISDFVNSVEPMGHGSSPLPAMIAALRAFRTNPDKRGQVMYILTDGQFESSGFIYKSGGKNLIGTEAVIAWLRENNKDGFMHVFPIILGPPPDAHVEESMKTIANENGGKYKYVPVN